MDDRNDAKIDPGESASTTTFSLKQLLGVVSIIAVVASLTSQLAVIGLVLGIYISTMIVGLLWGKLRVVLAGVTATVVFVSIYAAAWVQLGRTDVMELNASDVYQGRYLIDLLEDYKSRNGNYPARLKSLNLPILQSLSRSGNLESLDHNRLELVGSSLKYEKNSTGFELISLGRDGVTGGLGLDADRKFDSRTGRLPAVRLTIQQFLFESRSSSNVLLAAILASLIAGAIFIRSGAFAEISIIKTSIAVTATTVLAVVVGVILAAFYVLSFQSGH